MLIANSTPIFSCLFIRIPQMIFQGKSARVISITPEYAVTVTLLSAQRRLGVRETLLGSSGERRT